MPRDLKLSVALLAAIVLIAVIGLAFDGNWPKVLRVILAFLAYAGVLHYLAHRQPDRIDERVPFAWFALSGAAAGTVSGIVRPDFDSRLLVAGAVAGALLLGGVHYAALRVWRTLRRSVYDHAERRDEKW